MSEIALVVAMSKEAELLKSLMSEVLEKKHGSQVFIEGKIGGKDVVLMQCGIGKVNAACGVLELIKNYQPKFVLNSGCAGGIDNSLRVGDIVAGSETVYHDVWCGEGNLWGQVQGLPPRFAADAHLLSLVDEVELAEQRICQGLICSGDKFITQKEPLLEIKKQFPNALAVDMESAAAAQVCFLYHTPFLSLRIISDTPANTDDHSAQYADFWQKAPQKSVAVLAEIIKKL